MAISSRARAPEPLLVACLLISLVLHAVVFGEIRSPKEPLKFSSSGLRRADLSQDPLGLRESRSLVMTIVDESAWQKKSLAISRPIIPRTAPTSPKQGRGKDNAEIMGSNAAMGGSNEMDSSVMHEYLSEVRERMRERFELAERRKLFSDELRMSEMRIRFRLSPEGDLKDMELINCAKECRPLNKLTTDSEGGLLSLMGAPLPKRPKELSVSELHLEIPIRWVRR